MSICVDPSQTDVIAFAGHRWPLGLFIHNWKEGKVIATATLAHFLWSFVHSFSKGSIIYYFGPTNLSYHGFFQV